MHFLPIYIKWIYYWICTLLARHHPTGDRGWPARCRDSGHQRFISESVKDSNTCRDFQVVNSGWARHQGPKVKLMQISCQVYNSRPDLLSLVPSLSASYQTRSLNIGTQAQVRSKRWNIITTFSSSPEYNLHLKRNSMLLNVISFCDKTFENFENVS